MRSFVAFLKKELIESLRTSKLLILSIVFCVVGIMNPAIAKLTPWLMEMFAEDLAESGMIITDITVNAITSWTQFFKNIPIVLITFVFMYSSSFTKEYETGSLILILTKGISRYKVLLAKASIMLILWTLGYALSFAITYAYNEYYWDNNIFNGIVYAAINWWLFGIWVISLMVLLSVLFRNNTSVLVVLSLGCLAVYMISLIPNVTSYMPTNLISSQMLMQDSELVSDFVESVVVTVISSVSFIFISTLFFNKREI